jgi:hypothetical protein
LSPIAFAVANLIPWRHVLRRAIEPSCLKARLVPSPELEFAFDHLTSFLKDLLGRYFEEIALAAKNPKYIKLPGSLDVLELLNDEEMGGLNGLRVHFQQGCSADFFRTPQGIGGMNVEFGPPVAFLMMSMGPSSNGYRVNGKRLYELEFGGDTTS